MKQPQEMYDWLEKQNQILSKCDDSRFLDRSSSAARVKALDKAKENGFFLGMDWKWLESV